jgi:hypothetical protein
MGVRRPSIVRITIGRPQQQPLALQIMQTSVFAGLVPVPRWDRLTLGLLTGGMCSRDTRIASHSPRRDSDPGDGSP